MAKPKRIKNIRGKCPRCRDHNEDQTKTELQDNAAFLYYWCETCGIDYVEVCKLSYHYTEYPT